MLDNISIVSPEVKASLSNVEYMPQDSFQPTSKTPNIKLHRFPESRSKPDNLFQEVKEMFVKLPFHLLFRFAFALAYSNFH